MAVLLQSSELPEIIRLSNRVVVFSSGAVARRIVRCGTDPGIHDGAGNPRVGACDEKCPEKIWKSYSIGVVVLVVGIVLSVLTPRFLSVDNLLNVMTNASLVAIAGIGYDPGDCKRELRFVCWLDCRFCRMHLFQPGALHRRAGQHCGGVDCGRSGRL